MHRYYKLLDHRMEPIDTVPEGAAVVHGHFRVTELLSEFPHAALVTWVREPVARLASEYRFLKTHPDDGNVLSRLIQQGGSFVDFAEHPGAINRMSWYFSGLPLARWAFVGITEMFDQEIERFQRTTGIELRLYHHANAAPAIDLRLTDSGLRRIQELNTPDIHLYRACLERALPL